jgi:acyl carrier protein
MIFDDDSPETSDPSQDQVSEEPSGEMAAAAPGDGAASDPAAAADPASAPVSELGRQVIDLVADQLSEDVSNISPASRFQDDLKADSLDLVELVMTFEDKFGISVPDEDYEKILSVGDAIDYIRGKMGE